MNFWQPFNQLVSTGQRQTSTNLDVRDDPYEQQRNTLFNTFLNQMNQANSRRNWLLNQPVGGGFNAGHATLGPNVDTNPIWNEQQIQQRANAARASTDAQRDVSIRKNMEQLSHQGFATRNSPLAMQLAEQQRGLAMMANAANENNLRWNAAQGNAEHVQKAQIANQQAWSDYMRNEAARQDINERAYQAGLGFRSQLLGQDESTGFANALNQLLAATRPGWHSMGQNAQNDTVPSVYPFTVRG